MTGELLVDINGAWVPHRVKEIGRQLHERDPRLELTVQTTKDGAHVQRFVLNWTDPNGKRHYISDWGPHEIDRILPDVMLMDQNAANHESVTARIDKANAVLEKDASQRFHDFYGEALEHGAKLIRDLDHGKHFFGQAGYGDGTMSRQRRRAEERRAKKAR